MSLNAQHVETWSRWAAAAEDQTRCHSNQTRTKNWMLQFKVHKILIIDWKIVTLSHESWFLLWLSDGSTRIWCKELESMDTSYLVETLQTVSGVMVWGLFSWHTFKSLLSKKDHFNVADYLHMLADNVPPFMTTVQLVATSSRTTHHIKYEK